MANTEKRETETEIKTSTYQNPPSDLPSLTSHLETLITLIIAHINTRDLPSSRLRSSVASNFTTRGMGCEALSKQGFIDDYHDYAFGFPDHCHNITGMKTCLNSRLTRAEVFVNVELSGGHGVERGRLRRKVVIVFEVRNGVERWILKGAVSVLGFGGEG